MHSRDVHVEWGAQALQVRLGRLVLLKGLSPSSGVLHVILTKDAAHLKSLANCHTGSTLASYPVPLAFQDGQPLLQYEVPLSLHRPPHIFLIFQLELVVEGQPLYFTYNAKELTTYQSSATPLILLNLALVLLLSAICYLLYRECRSRGAPRPAEDPLASSDSLPDIELTAESAPRSASNP